MKKLFRTPSPAMVVALLALFVAMGGTGWAVARNSVGTKQLKNRAVTTKKLKNKAVARSKIRTGAVGTKQIGSNAVTGAKINEATLGTVPNAAAADFYVAFNQTAAAGAQVTLVTHGPLTIYGKCVLPANLDANSYISTTEGGSSFGAFAGQQGSFGPDTAEGDRAIREPGASSAGAPAHSKSDQDGFAAMTPSGASLAGVVQSWSSKDANQCRWSGYILKTS